MLGSAHPDHCATRRVACCSLEWNNLSPAHITGLLNMDAVLSVLGIISLQGDVICSFAAMSNLAQSACPDSRACMLGSQHLDCSTPRRGTLHACWVQSTMVLEECLLHCITHVGRVLWCDSHQLHRHQLHYPCAGLLPVSNRAAMEFGA